MTIPENIRDLKEVAKKGMDAVKQFIKRGAKGVQELEESKRVTLPKDVRRSNLRTDGTRKGPGWLGTLKRPDGKVSTELSISVEFDGKEHLIPLLVPTLSKEDITALLAGNKPEKEIIDKAVAHARKKIKEGKSPFKGR